MTTITVDIPEDVRKALEKIASERGISAAELLAEFSRQAAFERQMHDDYLAMKARANRAEALRIIDKVRRGA